MTPIKIQMVGSKILKGQGRAFTYYWGDRPIEVDQYQRVFEKRIIQALWEGAELLFVKVQNQPIQKIKLKPIKRGKK